VPQGLIAPSSNNSARSLTTQQNCTRFCLIILKETLWRHQLVGVQSAFISRFRPSSRVLASVSKRLGSRTLRSTGIRVPVADQHSLLRETCRQLFRTPPAAAGGLLPINDRTLSGVTRRENVGGTGRFRFARSLSIEPFEGSRLRLRQMRISYGISIDLSLQVIDSTGFVGAFRGSKRAVRLQYIALNYDTRSVCRASGFVQTPKGGPKSLNSCMSPTRK